MEPSSFSDYTNKWIEKVNRGSLAIVNDDFVRYPEVQARKNLNLNFMILHSAENIKSKVFEKLNESNLIRSCWEKLTRSVGNEDLKES